MINKFIFDPNHIISTLHNNFESSLAWTQQHFGILIPTFDLLLSSNQKQKGIFLQAQKKHTKSNKLFPVKAKRECL